MTALAPDAAEATEAHAAGTAPAVPIAPPAVGAIVFDTPDVLYDDTLWLRWLLQLVRRLGIRLDYAEFDRAWQRQLVDVRCGRREHAEALESFLLDRGLSWPQIDEIEAASRIQRRTLELDARPLPAVAHVIGQLAGLGIPLAAWADVPHPADKLAERLARLIPASHFEVVRTSFDLECTQPAAECYRAVLDALGQPADQVVYVGHDAQHLAGARAAGMRTVACNHDPQAAADHYLVRFDDLLALAKTWRILPRSARLDEVSHAA